MIDQRLAQLGDWRGRVLARVRALIHEADPAVVEEWKWSTPVWSDHGVLCTGEAYKKVVKLTFARGAALHDPDRLFNSSLAGNARRAIDIRQGESFSEASFKWLVKAAVAKNLDLATTSRPRKTAPKPRSREVAKPTLLAGGNPQIAKADGDAPVQAYIAAMPGWKCDVGRRLDALIVRTVPSVRKVVRWNSPFYGIEGRGWFLSFHCFTKYVKVTFFRGRSLRPAPPGESKHEEVRYLDIYQDVPFDEAQLVTWIRQAAELPGWEPQGRAVPEPAVGRHGEPRARDRGG